MTLIKCVKCGDPVDRQYGDSFHDYDGVPCCEDCSIDVQMELENDFPMWPNYWHGGWCWYEREGWVYYPPKKDRLIWQD